MVSKLRAWLVPPTFDNEELNIRAALLNAVLLVGFAGMWISGLFMLVVAENPLPPIAIYASLALGFIPLYVLLHQGYIVTASVTLVVFAWIMVTGISYGLGGLGSPSIGAYLLVVLIAGLLLGAVGAFGATAITGLALIGFYIAESTQSMPVSSDVATPAVQATIYISYLALAALFVYIATRNLEESHNQTRRSAEVLNHTLQDLSATTVSKDYVNNIIQSMRNLLVVMDPDGTIRTVNQAVIDLLGYTEEELIGQPFNDTLMADNPDRLSTTLLMRAQMMRDVNQFFRAKDGSLIPVSLSSSVMYHDLGYAVGVVCVAQDETERREIEEKLHYQAGLLENVSDAIISTTMDLTITSWNRAAEEVYGWQASEVIGKNLIKVVQTSFDEDSSEEMIKKQYIERGHWQNEVIQRRKDGKQLYILSSISLLRDSTGKPTGTVAVNYDITQRKLAELELKKRVDQLAALRQVDIEIGSTLDISQVEWVALNAAVNLAGAEAGFVVLFNDDGSLNYRGSGAYEAFSLPTYHDLRGIAARAVRRQEDELVVNVNNDPDYVADIPETCAVMSLPLRSQERLIGLVHLETCRADNFTPENFDFLRLLISRIAVAVDNARLYEVSQDHLTELRDLYTQVSKLEQLKTDMIRIASHDLRNPVGIINGYVELLRLDTFDRLEEHEREYVDSISEAVKRMQDIVTDILSLERIQKVAHEPFSEVVDMLELAQRVLRVHEHEAESKMQILEIRANNDDLPLIVRGDPAQLLEAVSNLVINAIKYTPEHGEIVVELRQTGSWVALHVTDTGYGIPDAQQERLFQPFFRAKSKETAAIEGLGLGLHLVKNIVERHRGRMTFRSVYGEGSQFGFELPLVPEI